MASGTITGTTSSDYCSSKIEWESTTNVSTNKSTVTAKLYLKRTNSYTTYGSGWSFVINIGGTKVTVTPGYKEVSNSWVLMGTAEATISHDDNGSKSITISATGGCAGTSVTSITCSGKVTLDTIPRASTITSASDITLGKECNVKWTPKAKEFYYKLVFTLGNFSKTITGIAPKSTAAYTYTGYTIPIDGVAQEITGNPPKGTMKVTLTTHTASSCTSANQIGDAASKTFTVTVPENSSTKPTISMSLSLAKKLKAPFGSLYIKGKTKVKANFTGSGKYGASVSYKMSVDGKKYGSPFTSGYLSKAGIVSVTGTVTDSRGFTNTDTKTITVIDYSSPKLLPVSGEKTIVCGRCDKDGNLTTSGTSLKIRAKRSYSKVMVDGAQNNFCIMRYRIVPEGSQFSDDTGWVTILAKTDTSDEVTVKLDNVVASVETAYIVQVGVIDDVGESAAIQFSIPTDFVTVDIPEKHKGRRIGILRYAQDSNEMGVDFGGPIFGGSVDSLKLGTRLTATETNPICLDDYKTPGCYYSPNANNSQYITGSPYTAGGFALNVRELQNAGYLRQELFYGRTTWVRHWDWSTWSEWWRYQTTTAPEDASVDYVIETGTKGGWTYKKWKGGTYQAFGIFEITPTSSTLNSTLYRTNNMTIAFPFTISSAIVSGTAVGHYWITNGGISGTNAITLRLMSDKEFSTTTAIEVRLEVVGTYG